MYRRQKTASSQIDECHNMQLCPEEVKMVVLGRKGFLQCKESTVRAFHSQLLQLMCLSWTVKGNGSARRLYGPLRKSTPLTTQQL